MTDIMASIGLVQLKRYPELLERRKQVVERYERGLAKINSKMKKYRLTSLVHDTDAAASSRHLFLMRIQGAGVEERNEIIEALAERGVATNVHYKPLPLLSAYRNMGFDSKDYPNACAMYENEITLPLHTKLSDEDVDYVLQCLEETLISLEGRRL